MLPLLLALLGGLCEAAEIPSLTFTPERVGRIISPPMGAGSPHNQPAVVDGHLLLTGNASHALWDVSDPFSPVQVSAFTGPFSRREAESHQLSVGRTADGRTLLATTSGLGVDLWDLSEPASPVLLASVELEGIHYGDNTHAVWGLALQGEALYVGGTNVGLFVLDVADPAEPALVAHLTSVELGGVSAGPLWALGDLLLVTTPKDHAGLATLDIRDPWDPVLMDAELPAEDSYIGAFYGQHAFLLSPWRVWDVLSDPRDIRLLSETPTPPSEYVSFGDGHAFLGALRPDPGVWRIPLDARGAPGVLTKIEGRRDDLASGFLTDDQFSVPLGNLVVLSDDEIGIGSVIAVHAAEPDARAPELVWSSPAEGATGVAPTARIGLSFSDPLDTRSLAGGVQLRPLGGDVIPGSFGLNQTVLSFWPQAPLAPDTTYELILPAGGLADLVGNTLTEEVRLTFSTGAELVKLPCAVPSTSVEVDQETSLAAEDAGSGATYTWEISEGAASAQRDGRAVQHRFTVPGRQAVRLTVARDGARRTCAGVVTVTRSSARPAPAASSSVAVAPDGTAWVVVPDAGTVVHIDPDTLARLGVHPVGDAPRGVAVGPDGRVWVTLHGEDAVVVLDRDGNEIERVALRWGAAPWGIVIAPDGDRALVAAEGASELVEIEGGGAGVLRTVAITAADGSPARARVIALSGDGAQAVLPRFLAGPAGGELIVIDTGRFVVDTRTRLAPDPGPDTNDQGRGLPGYLGAVVLSRDGVRAHFSSVKANIGRGPVRDGEVLDPDNTVRTMVGVAAIEDGAEAIDARVDLDDHALVQALATSRDGAVLFVASLGSNRVDALDAETGAPLAGAPTGLAPRGLAVTATGLVLVDDELSRTLTVLDARALLAGQSTALPSLGAVATVDEDPLPAEVLLGKRLFTNANSREMSQDGYIACASCHLDGADDGHTWDFTDRGEGLRNTTDLRGRRGTGHGPVHWTANFDEIQDFENDIRLHFGGSGLLDDASFEDPEIRDPLGAPKAGLSPALDALAAYLGSLDRYPRSPYRTPEGGLTEEAKAGRRLLDRLDCLDCHAGEDLTDSSERRRHDVGTARPTSGQRRGEALDGFDTPTLHGVWSSGPWLHDGSASTLADAVRVAGHGEGSTLTEVELARLTALLLSLEGELPEAEPGCDGCRSTPPAHLLPWFLLLGLRVRRSRR